MHIKDMIVFNVACLSYHWVKRIFLVKQYMRNVCGTYTQIWNSIKFVRKMNKRPTHLSFMYSEISGMITICTCVHMWVPPHKRFRILVLWCEIYFSKQLDCSFLPIFNKWAEDSLFFAFFYSQNGEMEVNSYVLYDLMCITIAVSHLNPPYANVGTRN